MNPTSVDEVAGLVLAAGHHNQTIAIVIAVVCGLFGFGVVFGIGMMRRRKP